eukprot:CAMPEP_0206415954 /NCGR_PEP_ID=MMETSP0294-20121207/36419_1 /ASSEMBLY_ACC=CAM_ASM_000327 /TAXON_ID=39354 /ORGANISM="Heterosigma akashiwo, Strain CCMP2393" /LENGTH=54 /DNA_ID=CAMNT_0053878437 /DNA_START=70 /DNA_END=234 /DNA_ORIENTATION=-
MSHSCARPITIPRMDCVRALVRSANHHAPDGLRARAVQHGVERQLVLGAEQALV